MSKSLDESTVVNELRGQSRFFDNGGSKREKKGEQRNERSFAHTDERPNARANERTNVRYSFQFYADQIEALKRLQAHLTLAGKKRNLSEMVREALDTYLAEQRERVNE